jgi:hypothetical protein
MKNEYMHSDFPGGRGRASRSGALFRMASEKTVLGLFGDKCGAIAGAVIAGGAVHGRSALPEEEGKAVVKKPTQSV